MAAGPPWLFSLVIVFVSQRLCLPVNVSWLLPRQHGWGLMPLQVSCRICALARRRAESSLSMYMTWK